MGPTGAKGWITPEFPTSAVLTAPRLRWSSCFCLRSSTRSLHPPSPVPNPAIFPKGLSAFGDDSAGMEGPLGDDTFSGDTAPSSRLRPRLGFRRRCCVGLIEPPTCLVPYRRRAYGVWHAHSLSCSPSQSHVPVPSLSFPVLPPYRPRLAAAREWPPF